MSGITITEDDNMTENVIFKNKKIEKEMMGLLPGSNLDLVIEANTGEIGKPEWNEIYKEEDFKI